MPIRKWDNLHVVTHNDMHIISVGSSFLGKITEPYENLVRMLGTPRDDNTKWVSWSLQFDSDPISVVTITSLDKNKSDVFDMTNWSINGHDILYYDKLNVKLHQFRKEAV
jgi:hypothetical protein|tara:strand:+ start:478 stop:807 length:330 start_codon:yes stop_codon:yes gene_type:complete